MLYKAYRVQVDHSEREGMSVGQSSSSKYDRTVQPVVETNSGKSPDGTGQPVVETGHEQNSEHAQIRTLLDRQRKQIFAEFQEQIKKYEFQADYDRRSIQKLTETIESQQEELHRAQPEESCRQDRQLLHESSWSSWEESLEELRKFQGSTFDRISRRKLVENQDTILKLTGRIQELQNEINCMNDSTDFQDAESVRSGHSHVASQPVSFRLHPVPGGMRSRSLGMPSRRDGRPSIWDTHGISGNIFLQIQLRILQHPIRKNWIHGVLIYQNQFTPQRRRRMRNKQQLEIRDASPDRQPKIQSSLVREILQRIKGQTNDDWRSQIFILTNSPHQQRLLVGR